MDIKNVILSFQKDCSNIFQNKEYISMQELKKKMQIYAPYYQTCKNKPETVIQESATVNQEELQSFIKEMEQIPEKVEAHNHRFIEEQLQVLKPYFDNILKEIDPNIMLDEEQRRAVLTDEKYCLLIAGAGAGKTTTMAAKVRYLVEKKHIRPEEIIVI